MIHYASSHFQASENKNLSFVHADSLMLPFQNVFDVVFSNSSFHWISDNQTLLAGIYLVLRPKGRLLVQMGGKGNMEAIIDAKQRVMSRDIWSPYFKGFILPFTFFSPDEYRPLLTMTGFAVKRLELIPRGMAQKGREGLTSSIRSVWQPFMERVPRNMREPFLSEVINILINENPPDDNGYIHLPMFRLEVEAVKE